ncbi:MAG: helix-turn-helix transcriptional regulator [Anaerolineae bacterium]|nr:helix-turn-helix transcriptional regulator [Anaerolineae bacterium]
MNTMHDPIQIAVTSNCSGVPQFGEQLGDFLSEQDLKQLDFAELMSYSKTVANRVINNKYPPRWMTFKDLKIIATKLDLNSEQLSKLIIAFTCALLRMKGFPHELR